MVACFYNMISFVGWCITEQTYPDKMILMYLGRFRGCINPLNIEKTQKVYSKDLKHLVGNLQEAVDDVATGDRQDMNTRVYRN